MPKRVIDLREHQRPLLDVVSYGRGGRHLTPQQREQILLTVRPTVPAQPTSARPPAIPDCAYPASAKKSAQVCGISRRDIR